MAIWDHFKREPKAESGNVVVPPGHKGVVARPANAPHRTKFDSGVWSIDFGGVASPDFSLPAMVLEDSISPFTVWIIQSVPAQWIARDSVNATAFLRFFLQVRKARQDQIRDVAVLAATDNGSALTACLLHIVGIGVHGLAPDAAAFVEVHRPTGIVVGMPGAPAQVTLDPKYAGILKGLEEPIADASGSARLISMVTALLAEKPLVEFPK